MFSNYVLNKTSLQTKNIGFVIFSTGMNITVIDGVLGGVHFGLLLPMDHTAHRWVWHWIYDINFHRRLELQVADVDVAILSLNKLALSLTDLRAVGSAQAVKVFSRLWTPLCY